MVIANIRPASEIHSLGELKSLTSGKAIKVPTSVTYEDSFLLVEISETVAQELIEEAWTEGFSVLALQRESYLLLIVSAEGYGLTVENPKGCSQETVAPSESI